MRIEQSRKHGAFDPRYPPAHFKPAPASLWRLGEERLDWQGFLARFFPATRRHDSDALAAYESYLNDIDGRPVRGFPAPAFPRSPSRVHGARLQPTQRSEDDEEPPATADTDRWENEGGASAGRLRLTRKVSMVADAVKITLGARNLLIVEQVDG